MKIKYRCRFCGMPSLFHARTGEATPLIPGLLFDIGLVFHEFIIFMCSIFFNDYQPSFPIVFKEGKQLKRFLKYYG